MSERRLSGGRFFWWRLLVAGLIAALSELVPIAGALAASLFYPQGVHSSSPTGYLRLTYFLNFFVIGGVCFLVLSLIVEFFDLLRPSSRPK
jgi:hypothetical protein